MSESRKATRVNGDGGWPGSARAIRARLRSRKMETKIKGFWSPVAEDRPATIASREMYPVCGIFMRRRTTRSFVDNS